MAYSADLRSRVLDFIKSGGSKVEASRRFKVCRASIYVWLSQPESHQPGKPGPKASRKFDQEELRKEVLAHPERSAHDLASKRGVEPNAIWCALRKMGFTRKKNSTVYTKPSL